MARQSRLEQEGISKREELIINNDYRKNEEDSQTEYSASHKDALSDGDPLGKGVADSLEPFLLPNENASKHAMGVTLNTKNGGGSYDIYGRAELEGKAGREWSSRINLYSPENEYGVNSVDTKENVLKGQYIVK